MKEKIYSPKEISIFDGFSRLVDKGVSLNRIRVSDIAKEAGVGKGTVYEYFKTKEEVIAKSILYRMSTEFMRISQKSNEAVGFESKCNIGIEGLIKVVGNQFAYFQLILRSEEINEVFTCLNDEKYEIIEFRKYVLNILDPIIDTGIKEGIINSDLDREYIRSVFISVGSGISSMVHFKCCGISQDDIEQQKKFAYTMLIKALS